MDIQEIILAVIGVTVAVICIRKLYRIFSGKDSGCDCCSESGHCHHHEHEHSHEHSHGHSHEHCHNH